MKDPVISYELLGELLWEDYFFFLEISLTYFAYFVPLKNRRYIRIFYAYVEMVSLWIIDSQLGWN